MELRGYDQFTARVKKYPEVAAKAVRVTARQGAAELARKIKALAPRDTGALRAAVKIFRMRKSRKGDEAYAIGFASDVLENIRLAKSARRLGIKSRRGFGARGYHWRFLERGTKYMRPRKFIEPAVASYNINNAVQAGIDYLDRNV